MNTDKLRSQRPYVLRVSDQAKLPFSLPLTLVVSPHIDRVPVEAAMRLGLYMPQSRWLSGVLLEGNDLKSVLRAPEILILGPELAVRVWPEQREGALIRKDDFSRARLGAGELRRIPLPAKGLIVAALVWSQRNVHSTIRGWRNNEKLPT